MVILNGYMTCTYGLLVFSNQNKVHICNLFYLIFDRMMNWAWNKLSWPSFSNI